MLPGEGVIGAVDDTNAAAIREACDFPYGACYAQVQE
jgi:hypothetical protein